MPSTSHGGADAPGSLRRAYRSRLSFNSTEDKDNIRREVASTPLSSKVDIRHGDYEALADAGVVLITGRQREKRAAPRIATIRKGG